MTTALALTGDAVAVAPGSPEFERIASHMAREFREATAEIARLALAIKAQTDRLDAAFSTEDYPYSRFGVAFSYNHRSGHRPDDLGPVFEEMKRRAWSVLVDALGVKNVMSVRKRDEFERQLQAGELPDINEEMILGVLLGLADQARDFAKEAAAEVFDILRPRGHWGGQYKTNDAFRVGRRVILPWKVEHCYASPKFRVRHGRPEQELTAIDGVFHLLDGKGVMREHRGPLVNAIAASPDGRGETEYFKFRCFKNSNLHLEMKRLDLVKELNMQATGERVLGPDLE